MKIAVKRATILTDIHVYTYTFTFYGHLAAPRAHAVTLESCDLLHRKQVTSW